MRTTEATKHIPQITSGLIDVYGIDPDTVADINHQMHRLTVDIDLEAAWANLVLLGEVTTRRSTMPYFYSERVEGAMILGISTLAALDEATIDTLGRHTTRDLGKAILDFTDRATMRSTICGADPTEGRIPSDHIPAHAVAYNSLRPFVRRNTKNYLNSWLARGTDQSLTPIAV